MIDHLGTLSLGISRLNDSGATLIKLSFYCHLERQLFIQDLYKLYALDLGE